jgi:hypothetical protein
MKKGESLFVAKVRRDLERVGATVEKVADKYAMHRSDLSVCFKGLSFRIECKASEDAEYRVGQCLYIIQHARSGGLGFFAHPGNWNDLFALICEIPEKEDSLAEKRLKRYSEVQMQALIQKKQIKNPSQKDFTSPTRDNKTSTK